MSDYKPKSKPDISFNDTPQTISNSPMGRGFSSASSADSVFDDISSKAHALFSILDEDHKGYLDNQMLLKVCDSGLTESQINDLILQLDHDGDGKVSANDFMLGLRTLAKRNSLIRASLRATTVTNSTRHLIKQCSDSSDSPKSRLESDETGSDIDDKMYNRDHTKSSFNSIQSIRIRTKSRQRLHRRLLTTLSSQQSHFKATSHSSSIPFDTSSVDEYLKCLDCQEHLYELYHILLSENPSLSRMYETILVDVVRYIQKTREVQLRLEKQIESYNSSPDYNFREIYNMNQLEALQTDLIPAQQEIHQKEAQNQTIILKTNEQGDSRVIKLQAKILKMNQENYNLEEDLDNMRLQLAESRSEFNAVRQSLSDKSHELEHQMSALIETVKENSTLKRQIGILQDINKKLYDANDGLFNMFESYPEWLRKQWKVEDIKPASAIVDQKFRRTSVELKPIKTVAKSFDACDCDASISTCVSCASDHREELKTQLSGKSSYSKSKSEKLECITPKLHESGDSGLSSQADVKENESDSEMKLLVDKQQKSWEESKIHAKYGARSELQNKMSPTTPLARTIPVADH
ncbi:unnamed protein product [Heterobilharzia americana]|nr:unnamed protein product [Heterobilharzia americana]